MPKIDRRSLIEFFKIESEEHFEIILNGLETLGMDNENWSVIDEIFRSAHTIKGLLLWWALKILLRWPTSLKIF